MEYRSQKLIRDKIPAIIEASGRKPVIRMATPTERMDLLANKLVEEAKEFLDSRSIEELADVLEVMLALASELGSAMEQIDADRQRKKLERGGFDNGIVLLGIKEQT